MKERLDKTIGIKSDISLPLTVESAEKRMVDDKYYYTISGIQQYQLEKNTTNNLRLYGKVDPIINTNPVILLNNNIYSSINIDKTKLSFNKDNWSIVVLVETGEELYVKTANNEFDLRKGIPAKIAYELNIDTPNRLCFKPLFECDVEFGDTLYVTNATNSEISSGLYVVDEYTNGIVYLRDTRPAIQSVTGYTVTDTLIGNVGFKNSELSALYEDRPNVIKLLKPDLNFRKVKNGELIQYYFKQLEVIDIIPDYDICSFSKNCFNSEIYNFVNDIDTNIENLLNHKGYPITNIVIGIMYNGGIKSNLSEFIESTSSDYIENTNGVYIGQKYIHSICSWSVLEQVETELTTLKHCFMLGDVLYHYNPFYIKQLRLLGELQTTSNQELTPYYATLLNDGRYIWRDVKDYAYVDPLTAANVDYPFINNALYVYNDIRFIVNVEKRYTKLNTNDDNDLVNIRNVPTRINQSYIFNFRDYINGLFDNTGLFTDDNFSEYKRVKC